jgi:membrane protein DedA with SNARE-associated domain
MLGASDAAAGLLQLEWVLDDTIIGNVAGDSLWYSVGYLGKMQWLYKHGRWFGIRPHHVERLEREMRSHARKLIIFAKIAYGLIVPTLVAAGMARVPWRKWFPVVFVVETLWSVLLVWIGFHTAAFIQDFRQTLHVIGLGLLVLVVLFVVMRFLRKRIDEQELALDPLQSVTPAAPLPAVETEKPVAERTVEITLDSAERGPGQSPNQVHRYVALRER